MTFATSSSGSTFDSRKANQLGCVMSESEERTESFVALGPNPHYRPPIMSWNQVEMIADEGTEFGIECDSDGLLSIVIRGEGKPWPHGRKEPTSGRNTIEPGNVCYLVKNDERGPAVDHEFQPSSINPDECVICNARTEAS